MNTYTKIWLFMLMLVINLIPLAILMKDLIIDIATLIGLISATIIFCLDIYKGEK